MIIKSILLSFFVCVLTRTLHNKKKELKDQDNRKEITSLVCLSFFFYYFISTSDNYHVNSAKTEFNAMNDPSPDLIEDANIHHKLNKSHLSYRELFRRLNKNKEGRIEVDELIAVLEKIGVETSSKKRWAIAHVSCILSIVR